MPKKSNSFIHVATCGLFSECQKSILHNEKKPTYNNHSDEKENKSISPFVSVRHHYPQHNQQHLHHQQQRMNPLPSSISHHANLTHRNLPERHRSMSPRDQEKDQGFSRRSFSLLEIYEAKCSQNTLQSKDLNTKENSEMDKLQNESDDTSLLIEFVALTLILKFEKHEFEMKMHLLHLLSYSSDNRRRRLSETSKAYVSALFKISDLIDYRHVCRFLRRLLSSTGIAPVSLLLGDMYLKQILTIMEHVAEDNANNREEILGKETTENVKETSCSLTRQFSCSSSEGNDGILSNENGGYNHNDYNNNNNENIDPKDFNDNILKVNNSNDINNNNNNNCSNDNINDNDNNNNNDTNYKSFINHRVSSKTHSNDVPDSPMLDENALGTHIIETDADDSLYEYDDHHRNTISLLEVDWPWMGPTDMDELMEWFSVCCILGSKMFEDRYYRNSVWTSMVRSASDQMRSLHVRRFTDIENCCLMFLDYHLCLHRSDVESFIDEEYQNLKKCSQDHRCRSSSFFPSLFNDVENDNNNNNNNNNNDDTKFNQYEREIGRMIKKKIVKVCFSGKRGYRDPLALADVGNGYVHHAPSAWF